MPAASRGKKSLDAGRHGGYITTVTRRKAFCIVKCRQVEYRRAIRTVENGGPDVNRPRLRPEPANRCPTQVPGAQEDPSERPHSQMSDPESGASAPGASKAPPNRTALRRFSVVMPATGTAGNTAAPWPDRRPLSFQCIESRVRGDLPEHLRRSAQVQHFKRFFGRGSTGRHLRLRPAPPSPGSYDIVISYLAGGEYEWRSLS